MYERLLDKNVTPSQEEFLAHIGPCKESFEALRSFLKEEIGAGEALKFDAHSRCWKMAYHIKRKYICDLIAEKDAFTLVTRLSEESIGGMNGILSPYAKDCIESSPYRHGGWIEYRILNTAHIEDAKTMLLCRKSS